ncbi:UDP-N-acetylglucosamine 2-epimerase [Verrucomicrobia bacterium]|nr:UDP-N-acetylglucosamine 2-epimerase [Verrucomicrobiota bacterium]
MTMKKVTVVITARPSYSRIKTALQAIKEHPELELQLVVAASALLDRYGSVVNTIEKDGFNISEKVFMVLDGENPTSMAKTTGLGVMELSTTFLNLNPDVVVTIADRYETIATAIAAAYMNIPVVHVQGGEVTGSIDEKVRHAITKLADLHLVSSEQASKNVIKMGENPDNVLITGCPSLDIANEVRSKPDLNIDIFEKYGGVGNAIDLNKKFVVVLQHPVTTEYENAFNDIVETLEAVHEASIQAIWFWPNVDAGSDGTSKGIRGFREKQPEAKIHYFKGMEPVDFLKLLLKSSMIIGNSSVGIRECSFLGVPAVNIGSRQIKRERGKNVIDVLHVKNEIKEAIDQHLCLNDHTSENIYGDGMAGKKIADAIHKWKPTFKKVLNY